MARKVALTTRIHIVAEVQVETPEQREAYWRAIRLVAGLLKEALNELPEPVYGQTAQLVDISPTEQEHQ